MTKRELMGYSIRFPSGTVGSVLLKSVRSAERHAASLAPWKKLVGQGYKIVAVECRVVSPSPSRPAP